MPFLSEFKLKLNCTVHGHLYLLAFCLLVLIADIYLIFELFFVCFLKINTFDMSKCTCTYVLHLEINPFYMNCYYDYFLQSIEEVGIKRLEWNFEKVR